ncbi:hypothetical protein FHS81_000742 [Pseudochelatococcus contaminans]|uniref:Uncharacterized protein n=2 Tax=Pseudochelatococcus contaminans TaxID=1538103 RepID=A0A7W5Z242_9HYPH|nr:hypothetical protein [Pseudochelatococcus contaminans]
MPPAKAQGAAVAKAHTIPDRRRRMATTQLDEIFSWLSVVKVEAWLKRVRENERHCSLTVLSRIKNKRARLPIKAAAPVK